MEESEVTALVDELAEYARVLDASFDEINPLMLASVAAQVRETLTPLYEILENGPTPLRNAIGGAWVAMQSAGSIEGQLALAELDWDRVGGVVSFTAIGLQELHADWSRVLGNNA